MTTYTASTKEDMIDMLKLWNYKTGGNAGTWITIEEFPEGFKPVVLDYMDPSQSLMIDLPLSKKDAAKIVGKFVEEALL